MNPLDPRNIERLARLAYEAYGHKLPWGTLTAGRKKRWCSAVERVVSNMMD